MKRLIMVAALAATMLLGAVFSAHAVEIEVTGSFDFNFGFYANPFLMSSGQMQSPRSTRNGSGHFWDETSQGTNETFEALQRVRTQINFITSENLQGVLFFDIGETNWGNGSGSMTGNISRVGSGGGGGIGTDGINIKTRRAYIDFNVPNTELMFRVGLQGLDLPAAVAGSPILGSSGTDMAAMLAVYKINDMISVAGVWARPWNGNTPIDTASGTRYHQNDEFDLFGLLVPVTVTGVGSFTPYALVGRLGMDAVNQTAFNFPGLYTNALGTTTWANRNLINRKDYMTPYWVGGAIAFDMLDPLTFGLDVTYGGVSGADATMDRGGWYVAGKVAYKTPWVTPTIVGWWTSGDDSNIYNGSERMPSIDANFNATTYGYAGGDALGRGNFVLSNCNQADASAAGTWGIALQLNDISFIENLTHQIIVAYVAGTNSTRSMRDGRTGLVPWSPYYSNPSNIILTTADYLWEVDFNTKYMIYENLAIFCETGVIDMTRSKSAWRTPENRSNDPSFNNNVMKLYNTSTAWKLTLGLMYAF